MKKYVSTVFAVTCLFISLQCFSQKATTETVKKFKPPVVTSYLGGNLSGALVTATEADTLITLPLRVMDKKNIAYPIISYGCIYKQKGTMMDDETGEIKTVFTTLADRFKTTPLPKLWITHLKGHFQQGEELYFFDIVAKDKENRIFLAPDLKMTIK